MLRAGARKLDQCPGHESLWYLRRGLMALCVERQAAQQQRGAPVTLPAPPSTEAPAPYPTPPSPEDDNHHVDLGSLLAWEVRMAEYYRRGQGPFHVEDSAGLLWEEVARRRQRVCAWAYARWVVELGLRHGAVESSSSSNGGGTGEGWAGYLGKALGGLDPTGGELFLPPGYRALVEQLREDEDVNKGVKILEM
jgi:hypothetical protein